jgi:hypothetical protein
MEISILGSKKILNNVKCLLHIQPPCGVIQGLLLKGEDSEAL